MAYTKPAVALLLAGASARVGLLAADNINAPFPDYAGTAISTNGPAVVTGSTSTLVVTVPATGKSCVACIRGGNVWCAAKYLFE